MLLNGANDRLDGEIEECGSHPEGDDVDQVVNSLDVVAQAVVGADDFVEAAQRALVGSESEGEEAEEANDDEGRGEEGVGEQHLAQPSTLPPTEPTWGRPHLLP